MQAMGAGWCPFLGHMGVTQPGQAEGTPEQHSLGEQVCFPLSAQGFPGLYVENLACGSCLPTQQKAPHSQ